MVELPTFGFGEINKEIINLNIGLSDLIKLATDQNESFANSKLFNFQFEINFGSLLSENRL